jgi:hypothetical protein
LNTINTVKKNRIALFNSQSEYCLVARPGFEPRQTVPKTVVLPLYYRAIFHQNSCFEMECKFTHIFHICNTGIKKKSNNFQKENDHKSTFRKSTGYYAAIHGMVVYPEGGQNIMFSRTKAHSTLGWALFGKQVPFSE